jgi:hypothetical protein
MFMNQSLGVKTRRESLMARSVTRYRTANIDGLKSFICEAGDILSGDPSLLRYAIFRPSKRTFAKSPTQRCHCRRGPSSTDELSSNQTTNNRLLSLLGREQANEEFMRAILLKGFGGLDSLVIETLPIPSRKQATPSSR